MNSDYDYKKDINSAVEAMRAGGVIAYPTDTVWGIGCDASCSEAVHKVFAIKHRADSKALITLVADEEMLGRYVPGAIPDACRSIINAGGRPVTVVYPHGRNVAPELLAADGSIGVRITRSGFPADLCKALGGAVVSTSANISGHPAARTFAEIDPAILEAVDYVALSGRDNDVPAMPSRVVKIADDGEIIILRD